MQQKRWPRRSPGHRCVSFGPFFRAYNHRPSPATLERKLYARKYCPFCGGPDDHGPYSVRLPTLGVAAGATSLKLH
eukprot:2672248-Pyramimonas_sp.AAC.1